MNLENLDKFYREVQTIDIRFKGIEGMPAAMTLDHYEQLNSQYPARITKLRKLALSVILFMSSQQIQYNVNRLQLINEQLNHFWQWWGKELEKIRLNEFDSSMCITYLDDFLTVNVSKQEVMMSWIQDPQKFLFNLHNAVMYKQGGIKYILYEIKNITGIEPKLVGTAEERAKEAESINNKGRIFGCTLTDTQTKSLFEKLSGVYIDEAVSYNEFTEVLYGSDVLINPIKWLKSNRDLAYFLSTLYERKMIENCFWQNISEKRQLFVNMKDKCLKARDLSSAREQYLNEGSPREAENIDQILKAVKGLNA